MSLQPTTLASIRRLFDSLDYAALGPIYCDEGGDAFWEERRGACHGTWTKLAALLPGPLPPRPRRRVPREGRAPRPRHVLRGRDPLDHRRVRAPRRPVRGRG